MFLISLSIFFVTLSFPSSISSQNLLIFFFFRNFFYEFFFIFKNKTKIKIILNIHTKKYSRVFGEFKASRVAYDPVVNWRLKEVVKEREKLLKKICSMRSSDDSWCVASTFRMEAASHSQTKDSFFSIKKYKCMFQLNYRNIKKKVVRLNPVFWVVVSLNERNKLSQFSALRKPVS